MQRLHAEKRVRGKKRNRIFCMYVSVVTSQNPNYNNIYHKNQLVPVCMYVSVYVCMYVCRTMYVCMLYIYKSYVIHTHTHARR